MTYHIEWQDKALRQLRKLDKPVRVRILNAVSKLSIEPRPVKVKQLQGVENTWRVRIGDWRILYEIDDDRLVVDIVKVGHRSTIYSGI